MLRAVANICLERQTVDRASSFAARVFWCVRTSTFSTATGETKTVLASPAPAPAPRPLSDAGSRAPPPPPPPPPRPPIKKAYTVAAALAITASLGGVYFYRKLGDDVMSLLIPSEKKEERLTVERIPETPSYPASASSFPAQVEFLIVGGGTAAFAALRALRAARPDAAVLVVGEELALPYMRPPLTKELWREPELAKLASQPDSLTFRQWSGKRRSLTYEPAQYYTQVEELSGRSGAAAARGWRVERIDVNAHTAHLTNGKESATISYKRCLLSPGMRARTSPALSAAAECGRALTLRSVGDVRRVAAALGDPRVRTVAVRGGGSRATELSAALAGTLRDSGRRVVQLISESLPLADTLPDYLARGLARDLEETGVILRTGVEIVHADVIGSKVHMQLKPTNQKDEFADRSELVADLVVECDGTETDKEFADQSRLETHPEFGGIVVNSELQARSDVFVAGDAACFYSPLGRRRVESHDHAVSSGRVAGRNMAGAAEEYTHVGMTWADLAPHNQYEAIGIIDSSLPTIGVFSEDAVQEVEYKRQAGAEAEAEAGPGLEAGSRVEAGPGAGQQADADKRYTRGVVFYMNGRRVVGVLLWNLYNRVHLARQVLAQGEFEDMFEVAKLFAPHEEE